MEIRLSLTQKVRVQGYKVNGLKRKRVTTIISERFGKGALMWWSEELCLSSFETAYET